MFLPNRSRFFSFGEFAYFEGELDLKNLVHLSQFIGPCIFFSILCFQMGHQHLLPWIGIFYLMAFFLPVRLSRMILRLHSSFFYFISAILNLFLMFLIYFFIIAPIGTVRKLFMGNKLRPKWQKELNTYLDEPYKDSYEFNQLF